LCDVCSVNAVCGRLGVNVALNRPAFMSTVWYDMQFGGYYWPWKANDGNRDPRVQILDNSCVVSTSIGTNQWWAVDLGVRCLLPESSSPT